MASKKTTDAARMLGKKSVAARKKKWGATEYMRRQAEYAKLGGRPKGSKNRKGE